jgi:tetratricopeptide (TPR) repeat protein
VLYSALDPRRSIETCLRGLETAKKVGDLGFQSRLYANLAVAYCALTDRCEAQGIEAAQLAVDLDRRLGLLDHLAVPLIVLGRIHQCAGDHARAVPFYEEALALAERAGDRSCSFPATTVSLPSISMSGTRFGPRSTWRSRRRCASAPGSNLMPSRSCRFFVDPYRETKGLT